MHFVVSIIWLSISHKFIIVLRTGLQVGHCRSRYFCFSKKLDVNFATCFGSLSCMTTAQQCPKCSFMLRNNGLCKISTYCVTFMIPLKQIIQPTPAVMMHPQIVIFHLPCSTVLQKYSLFSASLQPCYALSGYMHQHRILSCCILSHQTRLSSSTEPLSY